jgi:hypothetical protein
LPRWLAHSFERCERLTAYVGTLDRFTLGGAGDFLAGLDGNESLAAWQSGKRVSAAATRLVDIELPFFPSRVTAHPYLNGEGERLARGLGFSHASFYIVFDGQYVLGALTRIAGMKLEGRALDAAARDLVRAADLDVSGRTPYLLYVLQLDGMRDGERVTRSLIVRATGAAELTGAVAAAATEAVLEAEVPAGAHFAAEVLDPQRTARRLREAPVVSSWEVLDGPLSDAAAIQEGVL